MLNRVVLSTDVQWRYTEGFMVVGILLYDVDILQAVVMPSFDCSSSQTFRQLCLWVLEVSQSV